MIINTNLITTKNRLVSLNFHFWFRKNTIKNNTSNQVSKIFQKKETDDRPSLFYYLLSLIYYLLINFLKLCVLIPLVDVECEVETQRSFERICS